MIVNKAIVRDLFKKRKPNSHKGDHGRVLVVGGSEDYVGAVYLTAIAALRVGVDLVTVAAPSKVAWAINTMYPDLITKKLPGKYVSGKHVGSVNRYLDSNDVLLIGPGLGLRKETTSAVKRIAKTQKPKVIDADALKAVSLKQINNAILTPHEREFEILLRNSKLQKSNYRKALRNNVILLKGHHDKIISSGRIGINRTGSAGMTVGGTGDVLAGICAGFLAQKPDLFKAACAAAYLNGKLGKDLEKQLGYGFIASDLLKCLKTSFSRSG